MWTWAAACCRGVSHERAGTRVQDAISCFSICNKSELFVAIVSDGAGTAEYGGQGASLTCRTLSRSIRCYFRHQDELPTVSDFGLWVDDVRDLIGAVATRRMLTPREFAATVICLITNGTEAVIAHIGDGCAVVRDAQSGAWIAPMWPDHGEYASTTFFVTDEPEPRLRVARYSAPINAAAVFSDGLERLALQIAEQRPFEPFFSRIVLPVASCSTAGKSRDLSEQLRAYISSSAINSRKDDDKSLILDARK